MGRADLRKALDGEAAETCKTFHLLNKCVWIGQVSPLHDRQISDIVITLYFKKNILERGLDRHDTL